MYTMSELQAINLLDRASLSHHLSELIKIRGKWVSRNGQDRVIVNLDNAIIALARLEQKQVVFA